MSKARKSSGMKENIAAVSQDIFRTFFEYMHEKKKYARNVIGPSAYGAANWVNVNQYITNLLDFAFLLLG